MNGPADRLCKCLDGLRDLEDALENLLEPKGKTKRRRRLRGVFIPLHSLCEAIVDLLNGIQSEKDVHDRLPKGCTAELGRLRDRFVQAVPFERKRKLGELRNKVSAHYDRSLTPAEMKTLLLSVEFTEVGEWINIAVGTLCDTLKLNAYSWSASGPRPNTSIIMCQEPFMTVLEVTDGHVSGLGGFYLNQHSPKSEIFESLKSVVKLSDKLFERDSIYRIRGFAKDEPGAKWSKILEEMPVP